MSNATLHLEFDILKVEFDFIIVHANLNKSNAQTSRAHATKTTNIFPRSLSRMRMMYVECDFKEVTFDLC